MEVHHPVETVEANLLSAHSILAKIFSMAQLLNHLLRIIQTKIYRYETTCSVFPVEAVFGDVVF